RQAARDLGQRERAVEVGLARRQRGLERRKLAETQLGAAGEPDRALVRPILILELVELRLRRARLDLGAGAPWGGDLAASARACHCGRTRQRERAVVARRVLLQPQRALGLEGERLIDRVEAELHLHGAVVANARGAEAVAVALVRRHEAALAL